MSADDLARLQAELASAEAEIARLRTENAALAETFRAEPADDTRELLRRAALSLAAARDRADAAKSSLEVFQKTGTPYGLVAEDGRVIGCVVARVVPGSSQDERRRAIDAVLAESLTDAARELGVVLAASPDRYVRERPGRDAEGNTVFDVAGRVEGDRIVPAVSRAARSSRTRRG